VVPTEVGLNCITASRTSLFSVVGGLPADDRIMCGYLPDEKQERKKGKYQKKIKL